MASGDTIAVLLEPLRQVWLKELKCSECCNVAMLRMPTDFACFSACSLMANQRWEEKISNKLECRKNVMRTSSVLRITVWKKIRLHSRINKRDTQKSRERTRFATHEKWTWMSCYWTFACAIVKCNQKELLPVELEGAFILVSWFVCVLQYAWIFNDRREKNRSQSDLQFRTHTLSSGLLT